MAGLPGDMSNEPGTFGDKSKVNPATGTYNHGYEANRYEYGGAPGAADAARARYDGARQAMDMRQGQQLNAQQMNQSRGEQSNAMALMRARAMNQNPQTSVAGQQMYAGLNRVMAANQSAAASARGPAALALSQQQAAANTSNAMQQTSADAGIAAAQERAQAEAAYGNLASGMRGQDFQAAATNAQLEEAQRQRNDARAMGYEGLGQNVSEMQMRGNLAQQQGQLAAYQTQQQLEAERQKHNAINGLGWFDRAMTVAGNIAGVASDVRSKEGTVMLDGSQPPVFAGMDAPTNAATGAYKGYAASRANQPGGMFGAPEGDTASGGSSRLAPGTGDFMRVMGGGPKLDGTGRMQSMQTAPGMPQVQTMPQGPGNGNMLSGMLKGLGGNMALSDERSKLTQAMRPNNDMERHLAATAPAAYRYKDPSMPGAAEGVNVGPASAQEMAKNPVGATMIAEDPQTGMLAIDKDKALKTTMSGVSYVNNKVNNLARAMGKKKAA